MKCPLCEKEGTQNHLRYCKSNMSNIPLVELKRLYLEYNYPNVFRYDKLYDIYITKKMSLPDIKSIYNIDYNTTLFMLRLYNIPTRSSSEAFKLSNNKREKTNTERYGAKNVLTKGTIKYDKRNKTVKDKYGVDNVFQIREIVERINDDSYYLDKYNMTLSELKRTNAFNFWNSMTDKDRVKFIEICNDNRNKKFAEVYGDHPLRVDSIREKIKKSNLEKYGTECYFQSDDFLNNDEYKLKVKNTKIKNGHIIDDINLEPFLLYKRECRRVTYKFKKKLFEDWSGYDYYDNEYIKGNLNLNNTNISYPTIDHKTSIFYGFINGIKAEKIGNINNLCITKRGINCSKRTKCRD